MAWNLGSVSVHWESPLMGVNPNKGCGEVDRDDLLRDWGLIGGDCEPSEPVPPAPNKPLVTGVVVPGVPAGLLRR